MYISMVVAFTIYDTRVWQGAFLRKKGGPQAESYRSRPSD